MIFAAAGGDANSNKNDEND